MLGIGGSISQGTVIVWIACLLLVNSIFHMFFSQIVYMILLTVSPDPLTPSTSRPFADDMRSYTCQHQLIATS